MPNHVENHLTFDCSEERLKEILQEIGRDEDSALDGQYGIGTFDFNTYPLWHFNGDFLNDIGASNYEKYSAGYKYENDEGDNESYIDDGDEGMDLS